MVGGKGANLARLARLGVPVAPGFCVNLQAYKQFIAGTGLGAAVKRFLDESSGGDLRQSASQAAELQSLFVSAYMPQDIKVEIENAYGKLRSMAGGQDHAVAVRSSATAEDMPGASFAGQHDSYLSIRGESDLIEHVKRCWASLWNAHAVHYRNSNGIDNLQSVMAVVVQQMVPSVSAGVLFSANPVSGDLSETLINSSWGLGESVVMGIVVPDTYVIDKVYGEIKSRAISHKEVLVEPLEGSGTREAPVPPGQQGQSSLSDGQLSELHGLAMIIEDHYLAPQDIEWGFDGKQFYILQSRPITGMSAFPVTWEKEDDKDHLWNLWVTTAVSPLLPLDESVRRVWYRARQAGSVQTGSATISEFRVFNGFVFSREVSAPGSEEEARDRQRAFRSKLEGYWEQGTTVWEAEYYPDPSSTSDGLKEFDLGSATAEELLNQLREAMRQFERDWTIHWLRGGQLRDHWMSAFAELTGIQDQIKAHTLSLGPNKATEVIDGITQLARMVKASADLRSLFDVTQEGELMAALEVGQDRGEFRRKLEEFIEVYGYRAGFGADAHTSMAVPTCRDDPSLVFTLIKRYIPLDMDAQAAKEREADLEREALLEEAYKAIGPDAEKRQKFEKEFALGKKGPAGLEDHNFHLDQTIGAMVRLTFLEVARHLLQAGVIEERDDIFYLTMQEVEAALTGSGKVWYGGEVRWRKLLHEQRLRMDPPSTLGGDGSATAAPPVASAVVSPASDEKGALLQGVAASAGVVTGIARIVPVEELVPDLKPGEILVANNAGPLWTPLFPVIGGLVLDGGAVLLHAATVAREYKIPAVIQTNIATEAIRDGQTITVDGTNGIVYLDGNRVGASQEIQ
jgi:phosphohistidine swiveling domain-containing protein